MNTAISATHNDAAFYRNRKAMLMYPVIILPFIAVLFWLFGGGKAERYVTEETSTGKAGASGFNAKVPTAKNGSISSREVDGPGYGKAPVGQMLSNFTNTRQDSISRGLKAIPVSNPAGATVQTTTYPASSLGRSSMGNSAKSLPTRSSYQANNAAIAATRPARTKAEKLYYYNAPGAKPYYTESATDQQLDRQLQQFESSRQVPAPMSRPASLTTITPTGMISSAEGGKSSTVRVSDNLTASRLSDPGEPESPFLTAPTGGSRTQPTRAVLSGGNYGSKKVIAWMIPVVVHEDQAIHDGQQVKLRLLKEVTADGVTIPTNTILYAICQLSDDRLRLTVRSLQLGGQLIPLDLDVYDTDGSPGVNVPGLGNSSQMGGQMRSSAIQGIQVPGVGSLANNVLNTARMGASNSVRQATIRLRAGYNLFLKAQ